MTKFTKVAASALAALTITVGALATAQAQPLPPRPPLGAAIGLGIAGAIIGGAAYAATAPGYCRYVPRYDAWGNYRGSFRICDGYPY